MRVYLALLLSLANAGCGIALQSAFGWSSERDQEATVERLVEVASTPPGASVIREEEGGRQRPLGTAPLTDRVPVRVEQTVSETRIWAVALGLLTDVAGLVTLAALSSKLCEDTGVDAMGMTTQSCSPVLFAGVGIFGGGMFFDMIALAIGGVLPEQVLESRDLEAPTARYRVELPGYRPAIRELSVADNASIELKLFPDDGSVLVKAVRFDQARSVVAVMPVVQVSTGPELPEAQVIGISVQDQLRVSLSQQGLKTIDRGAQDSALKAQVLELKADSYRACYDEACQIELGKALAATHLLRSRLTRLDQHCLLSAELVDLALEVTVKAASAEGQCTPEAILEVARLVARELVQDPH